jgi:hypothetical protein
MKNMKWLSLPVIFIILLMLSVPPAHATGVMLTDDQLDQIQASALPPLDNIDKTLEEVFKLALENPSLGNAATQNTVNAFNSAVVIQSNIAFSLYSAGDINQINTANIVNGQSL